MATIAHEPRASDRSLNRVEIILCVALLWAAVIAGRLIYLQIFSRSVYAAMAASQQRHQRELPALRGEIFDRSGRALALNVPVKSICVNPMLVRDREIAAGILARVLQIDGKDLLEKMNDAAAHNRGFLWVKRKVSREEAERIENFHLTGVDFREETSRNYPKGMLAAHVLGSVDHEGKGNAGIELGAEEDLEGIAGSATMMTDVRRHGVDAQVDFEAQPGKNLTLTLDERVQYAAEQALKEAVAGCRCKSGSVVVMEPKTGDILAMTNYPTFDPNHPPKLGKDPVRLNLAVSAPYEPGSVFKLITLAAALEKTRLRPDSPINCMGGRMTLAGRTIHEAKGGFGVLPMRTVLAKSSNIGAIQVGLTVGQKNLFQSVRDFGFGSRTGLPLPAESPGVVHPLRRWQATSLASIAMGHEVMATTLQLAQAGAVLANDGILVRPRIVLKKQTPGAAAENEPASSPVHVIRPETAALMRDMMRDVVRKGGTGVTAKVLGYSTGGKTGSAQMIDPVSHKYLHGRYNASFLGLAPLNKPAVVVVVTLTGSTEYGGKVAAPVFQKVAAAALRLLEVPQDDLESIERNDAGEDEVNDLPIAGLSESVVAMESDEQEPSAELASASIPGGIRVPNLLGKSLREVLSEAAAEGLQVDTVGRGVARGQRPQPGSMMAPGTRLLVQFGN